MQLTAQEEDLARWLYVVAGFSRQRLARDFECLIAEIEQVVSTGLADTLSPARTAKAQSKRVAEFGASLPRDTDLYRSVLRDVFTPMDES